MTTMGRPSWRRRLKNGRDAFTGRCERAHAMVGREESAKLGSSEFIFCADKDRGETVTFQGPVRALKHGAEIDRRGGAA